MDSYDNLDSVLGEGFLKEVQKKIEAIKKEQQRKENLINKYVAPFDGLDYFLALKLTDEQIVSIFEKYIALKSYRTIDRTFELLQACNYKINTFEDYLSKQIFTASEASQISEHLFQYWKRELDKWFNIYTKPLEGKKILSKEEYREIIAELEKVKAELKKHRQGRKVSKKTLELYYKIIGIDKKRMANGESTNYLQSTRIALKKKNVTEDEIQSTYKNFIEWKNNPKNKEIIAHLLTSK